MIAMGAPPRIAIPHPTSNDTAYNQANFADYTNAIIQAGAVPVEVPLTLSSIELARLAARCAAVLLPGSPADVNPVGYGAERHPATAPPDPARERIDRLLLEDAAHYGKPVLGICFGAQMMNVFHGGTLVQDLSPVLVNHAAGKSVLTAHSILVDKDSRLAAIIPRAEAAPENGFTRLPINSSHHQAVATVGVGLRIVATCPQDNVAEAIEGTDREHFLLGVQWHPERITVESPTSRALFSRLAKAASAAGVGR